MGRRKAGARVGGPYHDAGKKLPWGIYIYDGSGDPPERVWYASEAEALAGKVRTEKQLALVPIPLALSVGDAIDRFCAQHAEQGNKTGSTATVRNRLRTFFEGVESLPLSALLKVERDEDGERLTRAARCYEATRQRPSRKSKAGKVISVDYQRHMLKEARRLLTWCVNRRHLESNPLDGVKAVGKGKKGKKQLRLNEARLWRNKAFELAEQGQPGAVAALAALLMALRQSEITQRRVRDLDNDGRWLTLEEGKTENSEGIVEVPEDLRPYLLKLAKGKFPLDYLFSCPGGCPACGKAGPGHPFSRQWVLNWTARICALAGVPRVCAHALRGTSATIGVTVGQMPHIVSQALRHGSEKITQDHYIAPGASAAAQQQRFLNLVDPAK